MTLSWPIPCERIDIGEGTLLPWSDVNAIPRVREDLITSCADPRMIRWTQVPHPYTEAHADDFLGAPPSNVVRWALLVDHRYSGNIELRLISEEHQSAEFGYSTAPWARGRGLMTQAVRSLSSHAFDHGVFRIVLKSCDDNAASRYVAEQAGFQLEGILRGVEIHRGKRINLAQYSLLATDSRPA